MAQGSLNLVELTKNHDIPLWRDSGFSQGLFDGWQQVLKNFDQRKWSFWRDWYQGFLDGRPLDWELQRRVALIPDEDWEKGPEHIAEIIEEIRKRFDLEQRIADLEVERDHAVVTEARLGMGGNDPPVPLDDMAIIPQTLIIWAAIDDLKAEVASSAPDKDRVGRIVDILSRDLAAILKWCARKGDLAVDTLIKWGVPIGAATVMARPDMLEAVIAAAKAWAGTVM